jgi:chaperonin cofactor prefoldin
VPVPLAAMASTVLTSENGIQNNPGTVLASAVDTEIISFRGMQDAMRQYQSNMQLVQSQRTENEMVLQELELLKNGSNVVVVYKMIGPILMSQSISDALQTVEKRLNFIKAEQDQIANKIEKQEQLLKVQSKKVQQMQSMLQQTTVQAVQAIAQQHT